MPQLLSQRASTTEAHAPRTRAPKREATAISSLCTATKGSPHSPQVEKSPCEAMKTQHRQKKKKICTVNLVIWWPLENGLACRRAAPRGAVKTRQTELTRFQQYLEGCGGEREGIPSSFLALLPSEMSKPQGKGVEMMVSSVLDTLTLGC